MPVHQDPATAQQSGAAMSRRSVLRGVGGAAAAVAGAGLIGADALAQPASTAAPAAVPDAATNPGYRLTAHIRAYYRTTRF